MGDMTGDSTWKNFGDFRLYLGIGVNDLALKSGDLDHQYYYCKTIYPTVQVTVQAGLVWITEKKFAKVNFW